MPSQPLSHREEYLKKKRQTRLRKFILFAFLTVLIIVIFIFLSRINRFRISEVNLSGGILVAQNDVSETTRDFLKGNYFFIFPKNNSFIYPHNALENLLKDKFKRIDSISIEVKNFNKLNISITERELNSLWCDSLPDSGLEEKCYFMDENGLIFASAPDFSGDAYFKYYGEISTSSSPIGLQYLASTSIFRNLNEFIARAKNLSIRPVYMIAREKGQFLVGLSGGGFIYIDTKDSLSKTGDNLEALLGTISATTTYSALNFDYIDLRFGNKLFYKLK